MVSLRRCHNDFARDRVLCRVARDSTGAPSEIFHQRWEAPGSDRPVPLLATPTVKTLVPRAIFPSKRVYKLASATTPHAPLSHSIGLTRRVLSPRPTTTTGPGSFIFGNTSGEQSGGHEARLASSGGGGSSRPRESPFRWTPRPTGPPSERPRPGSVDNYPR